MEERILVFFILVIPFRSYRKIARLDFHERKIPQNIKI